MFALDDSQKKALKMACDLSQKLTLITGHAGCGKTQTAKIIIENIGDCELACPTGKGAARLTELTGKDASTIHRMLNFDGVIWRRKNYFKTPLIIDEASMISASLMAKILEYKPLKLILIGDPAQLPPVECGQPFHDLIKIKSENVANLEICYRSKSSIHKVCILIREGKSPPLYDNQGNETFKMIETGDSEKTILKLLSWVKAGYYNPKKDMIISPRHGNGEFDAGIISLNKEIKKILNPSETIFSVNDRIIITKNNIEKNAFNGDLGFIIDLTSDGGFEIVLDKNQERKNSIWYERSEIKNITLAYAITCHRSQGSEAERVFFICLNEHIFQLNRNLIYTGISRAKKSCTVIGQMKAFYGGINRENKKKTILQYLGREKREAVKI